jgi:hypothetical protein
MPIALPRSKPFCSDWMVRGCRPTSCQWFGYKPNGPPQNGATIQRLPPRSNRISTDAFAQARELFDMFDQLMDAAQRRRIGLLREISMRREFLKRAQRLTDTAIEAQLVRVADARF